MTRHLVLTALGPDRPGLVSEVTTFLTERGVNIEDSRMAVLGAEWGMMILVSGDADEVSRVEKDLAALQKQTGLTMAAKPTKSPEEHRRATTRPYVVTVEAMDNEGIVRSVSTALYKTGVNIVSAETSTYEAPITGSPLFRMEAVIDVPQEISAAKLRKAMEELAESENVDVVVKAAPST
jgi:glycine cleavage system transcriptional repressor